ncbi:MAG: ArnT family glycosyltransferase, partial [Desulfobulbaceae bacterium]
FESPMPGNRLKTHTWWLLLWGGLLGTALYTRPLLPVDETRYLSVAWEMWQSNEFLVPHINGLPYSHKPPLLFWLIHFGWWLFGVNPWSARLTAPLFGFGSILLTMQVGRALWPDDKKIGRVVPLLLLGMISWSLYGTLTMFDTLVVFFSLTAYLGLLRAVQEKGVAPWLLVGFSVGLGLLAKGPVVLLYIVPPAVLAPWWSRGKVASWRCWYGSLLLALAGGIVLALCWAVPAANAGGSEYGRAILLGQTTGRMVHAFAHQRPFFWYAFWVPLVFFPWFFCGQFWRGIKHLRLDQATRFCLSAIIPAFILLSYISGKQVHYLLPLLPMAGLLMARTASSMSAGSSAAGLWPLAVILVFFGLALLVAPGLQLHGGDADMLAFLPPWLGIIPLLSGLMFFFRRSCGSILLLITCIATMNVLLLIVLQLALSEPLHRLYDQTEIGAALRTAQESGYPVAVYPPRLTDQMQFAGRLTRPLFPVDTLEEVVLWAENNQGQYCLFFTPEAGLAWLRGNGIAHRYKEGWLVVRHAEGLLADYLKWKTVPSAGDRPLTSPQKR